MKTELLKDLSRCDLAEMVSLSYRTLKCNTEDQLKKLVMDLNSIFPFENVLFAQAKVPDAFFNPNVDVTILNVSYPEEYITQYFEKGYHQSDAVLYSFFTQLSPVSWLKMDEQCNYNYPAALLANDFNMIDGWTHGALDLKNHGLHNDLDRRPDYGWERKILSCP